MNAYKKIIAPANIRGEHWCLLVLNIEQKQTHWYDSLTSTSKIPQLFDDALKNYFDLRNTQVSSDNISYDKFRNMECNHQVQNDDKSCGVFICLFILYEMNFLNKCFTTCNIDSEMARIYIASRLIQECDDVSQSKKATDNVPQKKKYDLRKGIKKKLSDSFVWGPTNKRSRKTKGVQYVSDLEFTDDENVIPNTRSEISDSTPQCESLDLDVEEEIDADVNLAPDQAQKETQDTVSKQVPKKKTLRNIVQKLREKANIKEDNITEDQDKQYSNQTILAPKDFKVNVTILKHMFDKKDGSDILDVKIFKVYKLYCITDVLAMILHALTTLAPTLWRRPDEVLQEGRLKDYYDNKHRKIGSFTNNDHARNMLLYYDKECFNEETLDLVQTVVLYATQRNEP